MLLKCDDPLPARTAANHLLNRSAAVPLCQYLRDLRQCDRYFRVPDPAYGSLHDDDVHDSPRLSIPVYQRAL